MAALILRDAAKIQRSDAERENRKRQRAGMRPVEPLFTLDDVESILGRFRPVPYHSPVDVAPGLRARFVEAGHMLGSTSIEVTAEERGTRRRVVFSGDIGPDNLPVLADPEGFGEADLVVCESTYGDRNHRPLAATLEEFKGILRTTRAARGRILVPAFAVGRTHQMIYHLLELFLRGEVEPFPVHIDSPMAIEANRIYQHHPELYDEEARRLELELRGRQDLVRHIHESVSPDDSRALNRAPGPCLIMAGAGMCNAGRILHHLRHGLWNPDTHVLIVGFQSQGTLGRLLVDGAKSVKIFGERVAVRAQVHTLNGFSAHADQEDLLRWIGRLAPSGPRLVLNHGETRQREALATLVRDQFGLDVVLPDLGGTIAL
jgi:metallo-beta-lactamase family protein